MDSFPGQSSLSPYQQQRLTFAVAAAHGWLGREPGILGTHQANESLKEAEAFLHGLEACNDAVQQERAL